MRRIIKADNEYNRLPKNIFFCIILIPVAGNLFLGNMESFLALHIFIWSMVYGAIIGTEYVKTKRIRLLAGLPLPVKTLSLYRHCGLVFGWLLLFVLLCLSSLISQRGHLGFDYLWWVLTKVGCIFIMGGCMMGTRDMYE